jgi:hypothetical protein
MIHPRTIHRLMSLLLLHSNYESEIDLIGLSALPTHQPFASEFPLVRAPNSVTVVNVAGSRSQR